jgi:purine-binding chemotaxis protein CheW
MKKKPKISYRELAKPAPMPPAGTTESSGLPVAGGQLPVKAEVPEPSAPQPAAPVVPDAPPKPRRVSSPIEVATTLRITPPLGLTAIPAAAVPPAAAAAPGHRQPATGNERPATGTQPANQLDAAVAATVEDYATILMRRLEAMAPVDLGEDDEGEADRRPLRERVRDRAGVADLLMFRIGEELFATDLASVEEAVTLPEIHHLPEMPAAMLGAFNLRGRLTPVYSPSQVVGVPLRGAAQAALLVRSGTRRLGLAVDDVEDVFQVDLATVREAPGTDDADGILLGVAHHGKELVAIVDAEALVAACVTGHAMEMTA